MNETTLTILNYTRIKSIFNKGEQVILCFRDGMSHGYISNIAPEGIYIRQINNNKTYLYDWIHFEAIAHAGVWVKPNKCVLKARMLFATPKEETVTNYRRNVKSIIDYNVKDIMNNLPSNFPDAAKEDTIISLEKALYDEWNNINILKSFPLCLLDNNVNPFPIPEFAGYFLSHPIPYGYKIETVGKDSIVLVDIKGNVIDIAAHYEKKCKTKCTFILNSTKDRCEIVPIFNPQFSVRIRDGNSHSKCLSELNDTTVKELLERGKYVYLGDPWEVSGEEIAINMFKSNQGMIVGNVKAFQIWETASPIPNVI